MARLVFLSCVAIPAVVFFAAPHGARACGRGGGGSSSSGSTASTASTGVTSSATAALSAARAMMLSRSAMFRSSSRAGYNSMAPGFGNTASASSPTSSRGMASQARLARHSQSNAGPTTAAAPSTDSAGNAANLDFPSRNWVIGSDKGDTVVTAQFAGLLEGSVILRKSDGRITLAPLDQISEPDRAYVTEQTGRNTAAEVAKN